MLFKEISSENMINIVNYLIPGLFFLISIVLGIAYELNIYIFFILSNETATWYQG